MEFQWDTANQSHLARYRVTPEVVREVASVEPEFFLNEGGGSGTHMMIGPDESGHLYTIILLEIGSDLWRPITGWSSDGPERAMYRQERLRHD